MNKLKDPVVSQKMSFEEFQTEVLNDYRIAYESREASLQGRKEVLTGKAKFGIFGDGKEVAQIAMSKAFRYGDLRTGYYRDQTFMFAAGISDVTKFFAQLYADTNVENDPASAGRQMNAHFATRFLDDDGNWLDLMAGKQSTADVSPTAGHMGRALGIAYASKLYRNNQEMKDPRFSFKGNEISFCTIGNASCSEGHFWEVVNAAGVLQVPLLISIWDDEYGISVPAKYQTTKENLGSILSGFQTDEDGKGFEIYSVKGWDYPALIETYIRAAEHTRTTHCPAIIHVTEITQPQGHSTSGSHERYKSAKRLEWEAEHDCLLRMRRWILSNGIAVEEELEALEANALSYVRNCKKKAFENYRAPIELAKQELLGILDALGEESANSTFLQAPIQALKSEKEPIFGDLMKTARKALRITRKEQFDAKSDLLNWKDRQDAQNEERFSSHLHSRSEHAALKVSEQKAIYSEDSKRINGFEILNKCFDANFEKFPNLFAIGEDVGQIGDVNQGFRGLQEKYGELRVSDTGIREMSIIGQGLGAAMRGLRPIVEVQYLDYLLYALEILSDDVSTLQYRTKGGQKAPLIVRTRGHRLEGIWHSGSPMGMVINSLRGMNVCVPRNMVQAAGMYNTLLRSDEPALMIECLNGYRLKEYLPDNVSEFTVPLGQAEILHEGNDVTIVTYGSCCRLATDAIMELRELGISAELVDVQTLLPFDLGHITAQSIAKTNRVLFLDEDVSGGASAYLMQKVLEEQGAYYHLDSQPRTLSAKDHRPAYASDGDYFSKPNVEDIVEAVYAIMNEYDPVEYPLFV